MSNSPDGAPEVPAGPGPSEPEYVDSEPRDRAWREWLLLGVGCFLMAAALRFVRIGYSEFFGAEFRSLDLLSGQRQPSLLAALLHGELSIYYPLLSLWTRFSGLTSEALLRLPSAMLGLLAWLAFFAFSRSYLRGTAFLICILVFALNPILVESSNDVAPYALLALCTVLANYMAVRALDKGGRANWIGYAAASTAGVLTHPLFWFVLPAHFLFAVLRRRRTPEPFRGISTAGIAIIPLVAAGLAIYANRSFPELAGARTQAPSVSDLLRNLVSVAIGNFQRFGANEFARGIMYVYILACLGLSYVYYRKRSAEAMAMPENVVWIDETQDVVGRWQRLSLRAFLLFQWFTFLVPALGIMLMGSVLPGLRLTPEMFIIVLPPLIVLIAMGIDAAPRNLIVSLGLLLVLGMANYDVRTLSDRGYGIKQAFELIRKEVKFDPAKDAILYTAPKQIRRSVEQYRNELPATAIEAADKTEEFVERQQRLEKLMQNRDRAIVIYHDDSRTIGKSEGRSPVREWMKPNNGFELADRKWTDKDLSPVEKTELRVYTRRAAGLPATPE
ncbi:MAG: glycosyltransferase family 39 protein [Candidatus Sumerlaeaceae bacterium]